jgi:hypothetical protein
MTSITVVLILGWAVKNKLIGGPPVAVRSQLTARITTTRNTSPLMPPARQAIIARQLARLEVVEMGAGSLCYCWARSWWASGRISADAAASSLIQEMIVTTGSSALTRAR